MLSPSLFLLTIPLLLPAVSAHGYIKQWGTSGQYTAAQKTDLSASSFRSVSSNTGWIGSHFLTTTPAIACGATTTPFHTTAAPEGPFFSESSSGAGMTLSVNAGGSVDLWVSGNPGDGWPHHEGHVQTYLGMCGAGEHDCEGFDASGAEWFKIQGEKGGIQDTLVPAYDGGLDGNKWTVTIPEEIVDGSYMFRWELIAFGQSNSDEGGQDQYYVFCGQISVSGGTASVNNYETIKFPGGYPDGNIDQDTLPGPGVLAKTEVETPTATTSMGTSSPTDSVVMPVVTICNPQQKHARDFGIQLWIQDC